jgi:acetyltransferase-like isoleucine patch superfamily enzyme
MNELMKSQYSLAFKMPWVIRYEIRRYLALPFIRTMFYMHGIRWGRRWKVWGMPIIQRYRGSQMILGDGLLLRSWKSTNPLVPNHPVVLSTRSPEAVIKVGADVGMTGAVLVAADNITIGDRTFVGSNVTIVDTDFHPLDPLKRQQDVLAGDKAPVFIAEDVFIGMNSLILKGSRIGRGAVIGAGSVVVGEIPPIAVVGGNPARIIRYLDRESGM